MTRYFIFSGIYHYPGGGWDDFLLSGDITLEEAKKLVLTRLKIDDWAQIVDVERRESVCEMMRRDGEDRRPIGWTREETKTLSLGREIDVWVSYEE